LGFWGKDEIEWRREEEGIGSSHLEEEG
jgi:hypothetical protein